MSVPTSDNDQLEQIISAIDATDIEIINLIRHRTDLERVRQSLQVAAGGTRITHQHEIRLFKAFCRLGSEGMTVATALVRLARSPRLPVDRNSEPHRVRPTCPSEGDKQS